jgi:hypothetical protein
MSDTGDKSLPDSPPPVPEGVAIGKGPAGSNQPAERTAHQRKGTAPPRHKPRHDPKKALLQDALAAARKLKREHRAYHEADAKGFRKLVAKAHARVFRLKPGPKADRRIAEASRERASGAKWQALYLKHIDHYSSMPDFTRDLSESGFQRKVNAYLQRHPAIRRRGQKDTAGSHNAKRLPPA